MLGLALLAGGAVTPAWAMDFNWPSIGSETERQQEELDATRWRQQADQFEQARQMRELQDQVEELRRAQDRLERDRD